MKFQVGKKYLVKNWEDMKREYGLTDEGFINTHCLFTLPMRRFCGTEVTCVKVALTGYMEINEDNQLYWWDDQMVVPLGSIAFYLSRRAKNDSIPV